MTRLPVSWVGPAALLGGLTMSAVFVAGQSQIGQLAPSENRRFPVRTQVESPFRVIGGIDVPDPAPPRESVPSPSDAAAPEAVLSSPGGDPLGDLLAPPAIPADPADSPGLLQRRADAAVALTPEPARPLLAAAADTAFGLVHGTIDSAKRLLGLGTPVRDAQDTAPVMRPVEHSAEKRAEVERAANQAAAAVTP